MYSQLIFDKGANNIKGRKEKGQSLKQMVLGKLGINMQRIKLDPYFRAYAKIN